METNIKNESTIIKDAIILTGKGVEALKYQGATPTTAILEIITNAVSNAKPNTTAKVVVDIRESQNSEDLCRVMVMDYGVGMDLEGLRNLKNYGSVSSNSPLNRFGTGFNTFMLKLTDAKRPFMVVSRKKGKTAVMEGPIEFSENVATVDIHETSVPIGKMGVVPADLLEKYGEPVTVMWAETTREMIAEVRSLGGKTKSAKRLSDVRRALAEHISVRYWPLLEDDGFNPPKAEIYVHELKVTNPATGKKVLWNKPVKALDIHTLAPIDNGKRDVWTADFNGKTATCLFYTGLLNEYSANKGFMGIEPLDLYFQGNEATSGYMIVQDGLVTAVPVFTEIFDNVKHPEYNKCAGYLMIWDGPDNAMNMTVDKNGLCIDEAWSAVFRHIRENKSLYPSRSSQLTKTVDLQSKLFDYYERTEKNIGHNKSCSLCYADGPIRVPAVVTDAETNVSDVYLFASSRRKGKGDEFFPCSYEDYSSIITYGNYLTFAGKEIGKIVLVANNFNKGMTELFERASCNLLKSAGLAGKVEYMTHKEFNRIFG